MKKETVAKRQDAEKKVLLEQVTVRELKRLLRTYSASSYPD
jgi:hypothetical protein